MIDDEEYINKSGKYENFKGFVINKIKCSNETLYSLAYFHNEDGHDMTVVEEFVYITKLMAEKLGFNEQGKYFQQIIEH